MASNLIRPIRTRRLVLAGVAMAGALSLLVPVGGASATGVLPSYTSDTKPDLVAALVGYNSYWKSSGTNDLHGTVLNASVLERNDKVTSWINQNATAAQKVRALQNSNYLAADGSGYDQSITIADGLGKKLGALYVAGRINGKLPLVSALINSSNGSTGAYVSTSTAKATFSYPRPYLTVDPSQPAVPGDSDSCAPSKINGSSLASIRKGKAWAADSKGNLKITRLAPIIDTSHQFANSDVADDPSYGSVGLCTGGSFPSGHTTTAYEAGITLATLLPELAPQILARASEAGNNRIVLGVHYALDIVGGRMSGEIALASRWSDPDFRSAVLAPARAELVNYLQSACGASLAKCIAKDSPYTDNPYGGAKMPGGTAQIVTNRSSALKVYTERLTYGFKPVGSTKLAASVPTGADNLLLTTFPTLTDAQRTAVLAQTEIASGYPLDTTSMVASGAPGSWERLNLAAAMSAKVRVNTKTGAVKVLSVGGTPKVVTVK